PYRRQYSTSPSMLASRRQRRSKCCQLSLPNGSTWSRGSTGGSISSASGNSRTQDGVSSESDVWALVIADVSPLSSSDFETNVQQVAGHFVPVAIVVLGSRPARSRVTEGAARFSERSAEPPSEPLSATPPGQSEAPPIMPELIQQVTTTQVVPPCQRAVGELQALPSRWSPIMIRYSRGRFGWLMRAAHIAASAAKRQSRISRWRS